MKSDRKSLNDLSQQQYSFGYQIQVRKNLDPSQWSKIITRILVNSNKKDEYQILLKVFDTMKSMDQKKFQALISHHISRQMLQFCQSIASLLLIFKLKLDTQGIGLSYVYKELYNKLIPNNDPYKKEIKQLEGQRIQNYSNQLINQIQQIVDIFPHFFSECKLQYNKQMLEYLLDWILIFPIKSQDDLLTLDDFCKFIFERQMKEFDKGNNDLILRIFHRSLLSYQGNGNYFLILKRYKDFEIEEIVKIKQEKIEQFSGEDLVKIFKKLTQCSLTRQVLHLIYCISILLKNLNNFYALKLILSAYVQPYLIKNHKFNKFYQQQIQKIVKFYTEGFLKHIKYNKQNVQYIMENIQYIEKTVYKFWIKTAYLEAYYSVELVQYVQKISISVNPTLKLEEVLTKQEYDKILANSWKISQRNIKEKKKYTLSRSKYSGILNNNRTSCYIISIIQALYMTRYFPNILENYSQYIIKQQSLRLYYKTEQIKCEFLKQLLEIFRSLQKLDNNIRIDNIKKTGPKQFSFNQQQQDAHHYIVKAFQLIEIQINKQSQNIKSQMIKQFKKAFQIQLKITLSCKYCSYMIQHIQSSYIHMIQSDNPLKIKWQQKIDAKCQKCKTQSQTLQNFQLIKLPQILFVNIKRFDFQSGKGLKKFGGESLVRKFQYHILIGFIAHIGESIHNGHYVLYFRKQENLNKWYSFNDNQTFEFQIQQADEQFEGSFKQEFTPYIAIYKKRYGNYERY